MKCAFCGDPANTVTYGFSRCSANQCMADARSHFEYVISSVVTAVIRSESTDN